MANNFVISQKVDLNKGIDGFVVWPHALLIEGDNLAHTWEVDVYQDGKPATLDGMTAKGYFVRSDGSTVDATGSVSGNKVSVTFPSQAYAYEGDLQAIIRLTNTDGSLITLSAMLFRVVSVLTDRIVDPENVIPSLNELLAQIDKMKEATSNANTATSSANAAASSANTAAGKANDAASAANTAKSNADAATKSANDAAKSANAAKDAANTAASSANTATSKANEAATKATTAATNADTATGKANTATTNANAATKSANDAASAANEAKSKADTATAAANTATERANAAAKAAEDIVVEKNIATKDYVAEQIDGIEIGGTNLYGGTLDFIDETWDSFRMAAWKRLDEKYRGFTVMQSNLRYNGLCQYISVAAGEEFTFSCYAKRCGDDPVNMVGNYYVFEGASASGLTNLTFGNISKDWARYSFTIEIKTSGGIGLFVENWAEGANDSSCSIAVCAIKVERGNKATDWSPAPEDLDAKIGTTNLFAMSKSVPGYLSDKSDGNIVLFHGNGETTSDYIPCRPGDVFTIQTWITSTSTDKLHYLIYCQWFADRTAGSHIGTKQSYSGGQPGFNHAAVAVGPAPETAQYLRVSARLYNNGKIKVEHSDKPTEWTPAPEDVDNSISRSLRHCTVTYDYGGRNLKEIFGTPAALHAALAAEDYTNIAVGDYWPITLNGTFWDYGSYTVPSGAKYYSNATLQTQAGTTEATYEGTYVSDTAVSFALSGTTYYVAVGDCQDHFARTCNNVAVKLEVAGINHYWRYGDSGELTGNKPHIVFISRDCLPFIMRMRKGATKWEDNNAGNPWLGSALYNTLNDPEHGILHLVSQDNISQYLYRGPNDRGMRTIMEKKAQDDTNVIGWSWYNRGKLFLPSTSEVCGYPYWTDKDYGSGLGNQFPIFRDSLRHISKGFGDNGGRIDWWQCSTHVGDNTSFARVNSFGYPIYNDASLQNAVPICFIFA